MDSKETYLPTMPYLWISMALSPRANYTDNAIYTLLNETLIALKNNLKRRDYFMMWKKPLIV
jgi:hypothetical protein